MSDRRFGLADLIAPMERARFVAEHWAPGRPMRAQASTALMEALQQLRDRAALLGRHAGKVVLFGGDGSRATVAPEQALAEMGRGNNLYLLDVQRTLPELARRLRGVTSELGVPPDRLYLEIFIGRPGGVSTRHYDHDVNFQILVEGEKRWSLEANAHITNPLQGFHPIPPPRRDPSGWDGFVEEAFAGPMPAAFDPQRVETVQTGPGTVLFLPRAHWHEVLSQGETVALNVVLKGTTWATALGKAIETALLADPVHRAYCDGVSTDEHALAERDRDAIAARFESMRAAATRALATMTPEDVQLAPLLPGPFRWRHALGARSIRVDEGESLLCVEHADSDLGFEAEATPLVEAMLPLRGPFTWVHARALAPQVSSIALYNLLAALLELGWIESLETP